MTNQEFQCHQCGEIFIVRSEDNARSHNYRPICRKKYYEQKMLEEKQREDIAWQKKHEQDVLLFEENLKEWNLLSLEEMGESVRN